jgi:hypothetical protein
MPRAWKSDFGDQGAEVGGVDGRPRTRSGECRLERKLVRPV